MDQELETPLDELVADEDAETDADLGDAKPTYGCYGYTAR